MRKFMRSAALASVSLLFGWSGPACAAQLARAWVSGKGVDATDCGPLSKPCRQIAYLLNNSMVAPGGEIDILDPMGMQPFTIEQSLSIVNDGVGTASVQGTSGAKTIFINAGPNDAVVLRGLSIDGVGAAADGVDFFSGGSLEIVRCVIRRFTNDGVFISNPSAMKFTLIDSYVSDNGQNGVNIVPKSAPAPGALADVSVLRTTMNNNGAAGFAFDGSNLPSNTNEVKVNIEDSIAANNVDGVTLNGSCCVDGFNIKRLAAINNSDAAINTLGNFTTTTIDRTVLTGSPVALKSVFGTGTWRNNTIRGNGSFGSGSLFPGAMQ
jgi:hypothetical protein